MFLYLLKPNDIVYVLYVSCKDSIAYTAYNLPYLRFTN